MSAALTLDGLAVPMRALRALALDFADLPAPTLAISTVYPKRLELSLHQGLGPFDVWRMALGIDPQAVRPVEHPVAEPADEMTVRIEFHQRHRTAMDNEDVAF